MGLMSIAYAVVLCIVELAVETLQVQARFRVVPLMTGQAVIPDKIRDVMGNHVVLGGGGIGIDGSRDGCKRRTRQGKAYGQQQEP